MNKITERAGVEKPRQQEVLMCNQHSNTEVVSGVTKRMMRVSVLWDHKVEASVKLEARFSL